MSYASYLTVLYAQLLVFLVVAFALIGYYFQEFIKKEQVLATNEIEQERPRVVAKSDEPVISDLSYLDIIYQQSHENTKIKDVRLHGKHKN